MLPTDGRLDGRRDEWTKERTEGWTVVRKDRRTDEWMDGRMVTVMFCDIA